MKRTIKGKTYNTDSAVELGTSMKKYEVEKGVKTLVVERLYEDMNCEEKFVVTTIIKFKTNNDCDHLSSDDMFIGREKSLTPVFKEKTNIKNWKNHPKPFGFQSKPFGF